ncbi:MAG TPA: hypothetical protein PK537_11225 [Candidatus Limiplasma sp.]|nr:hypothetical protein [Candidatus Limiplasma sp.]
MKQKMLPYMFILAAGLLMAAAGVVLLLCVQDAQGVLQALPYLLIGIGSGLFGQGMGSLISLRKMQRDPETARKLQIEKKDERNIALTNRAKAKAFDTMIYTFAALLLAFTAMGAPTPVLLLMVFGYVFVIGSEIYHLARYNKEM